MGLTPSMYTLGITWGYLRPLRFSQTLCNNDQKIKGWMGNTSERLVDSSKQVRERLMRVTSVRPRSNRKKTKFSRVVQGVAAEIRKCNICRTTVPVAKSQGTVGTNAKKRINHSIFHSVAATLAPAYPCHQCHVLAEEKLCVLLSATARNVGKQPVCQRFTMTVVGSPENVREGGCDFLLESVASGASGINRCPRDM